MPTPQKIDRYEIRELLGAGAFGSVYRAYDPKLERDVALKVLRPEMTDSPQALERFLREAKAAAKLLHPHIVPVYDTGRVEGVYFIVSAFIPGRTLASAVPEDGMEPRRAAELAAQLASALGYAHKQGVLHRDVKPANALLDEEGALHLTDFGLAGWTQEQRTRLTRLGAVMGTPAYMAPEQAAGDTARVGPASDVYSAGVVLYQLLTGRLPFDGGHPVALSYHIINVEPPPPSQHRPGLDAGLEAICLKAMAKDPAQRYGSAAEMAAALTAWAPTALPLARPMAIPAAVVPPPSPADRTKGLTLLGRPDARIAPRPPSAADRETVLPASGLATARPPATPKAGPKPVLDRRDRTAPPSFLSTPWPWAIGGVAAGLLLLGGVAVGAAMILFRSSRPAPVVFAAPPGSPEVEKPRPPAAPPGPDSGPAKPADAGPDGAEPLPIEPGPPGGVPLPPPIGPAAPPAAPRAIPDVLQPDESRTAAVRLQLPILVFSTDFQSVMALHGFPPMGLLDPVSPDGPAGSSPHEPAPMGNGFDPTALKSGLTGLARYMGKHGVMLRKNNPFLDRSENDFDPEWLRVDANLDLRGRALAQQLLPVRVAEITATFPYKKEVEEFQKKLGLPSIADVFTEKAGPTKDGAPSAAFRFLGVAVQRRELDEAGKPVIDSGEGWQRLDVEGDYQLLLTFDGRQTWPDVAGLASVEVPELAMKKLATFGEHHVPPICEYPRIEPEMAKLAESLHAVQEFNQERQRHGQPEATNLAEAFRADPPPGGAKLLPPEHCLIRVFDFAVEPGKTYEYRLQVRMANPNRGPGDVIAPPGSRPTPPIGPPGGVRGPGNVIAPPVAAKEELTSKDWYVLPDKVTVPPELYFYAVDQAVFDAREGKDKNPQGPKEPKLPVQPVWLETQTVLQIQKWVDYLPLKNRSELAIGDWVIAERVVATRGEPIGRQRVEAPYWRMQQHRFTMAADQPAKPNDKKYVPSVEAPLAPVGQEPILVDFTGGDMTYTRTPPKTDDAAAPAAGSPISDKAPVEVLLLTADGKLLAHNSAKDASDPDRVKRLEGCRGWIRQVKKALSQGTDNPFGH